MCDWMYSRLSNCPAVRQRMWGIFSSGEFGGIVEAICDLYAHTGKAEHLALAKLFDLDPLIDACAAGHRHPRPACTPTSTSRSSPGCCGCTTRPARSAT